MIGIVNNVVQINNQDYESVAADFINKHIRNFLVIMADNKIRSEPTSYTGLIGRVDIEIGEIYISKKELKKYLAECRIAVAQFEVALKKQGVLLPGPLSGRMRLGAGWKGGIDMNVRVYTFKLPNDLWTKEEVEPAGA